MAADPVRRAGNGSHSGRGRDGQLVSVDCSTRWATCRRREQSCRRTYTRLSYSFTYWVWTRCPRYECGRYSDSIRSQRWDVGEGS
jgi:hypothetical protein